MSISTAAPAGREIKRKSLSAGMTALLAVACGLTVANLYYAQPLIGLIAPSVGLSETVASFIVTFTQVGYCVGLVLLVPLGDLLENRGLTFWTLCASVAALVVAAFAPSAEALLTAAFCIGLTSVSVQILLPIAAHLAPEETRGTTIGNVMSGLLFGIMLARPFSSLVAATFGWRAVFIFSAGASLCLAFVLRRLLPARRPEAEHGYAELIASLWALLRDTPVLRRRAGYQAALFASFTLFWTAVPLELAGPTFGLTQRGIALFALAGAGGALSAPIAGRIADRGWGRIATGLSMAVVGIGFLLARMGGSGAMAALLAGAILLDGGVQASQVVSQRIIYALTPEARSRLNGLYIAIIFVGGGSGSAVASLAYTLGGWPTVCWIGMAFPAVALLFYAAEFRGAKAAKLAACGR